ncbi:MAG: alpha/beta fold hydrolase [Bacillota bacterium]
MQPSEGTLTGQGGLKLFYRLWEPDQVKGSLLLVPGAGEHGGRYEHVAAWFVSQGLAVWAMDHRGHGRSEGDRMHIDRFDQYVADLHAFVQLAAARHGKPVMVGHSMGGLIAYHYAVAHPDAIRGLVLSSPWFRNRAEPTGVQKLLLPALSVLVPRARLKGALPPEACHRNPEFLARDRSDPLRPGSFTPRWFSECVKAAAACHSSMSFPSELPVFFLVSGTDHLLIPEAARAVFDRIQSRRKAFRFYPERYHELFNDPGYEEVFADLLAWLRAEGLAPA